MINKIFKKIKETFNDFLKSIKKDYNNGFSMVNQPCFDKNGKFIGWFSRSMAAAIFVFCRDRNGSLYVLASERGKGAADFQGYWNCPCGYLDFNETLVDCATRELLEETGVKMPNEIVKFDSFNDAITANHQNVTFRFVVNIDDKTVEELNHFSKKLNEKNEVGQIKWINIDDIDKYKWAFGHDTFIKEKHLI